MQITVDDKQAKAMAKSLASRLKGMGVEIGHSQALEAVAAALGCPEWNVLATKLQDAPKPDGALDEIKAFARSRGHVLIGTIDLAKEYNGYARQAFDDPAIFAKAAEEYARTAFPEEMAREMMWNEIAAEIDSGGGSGLEWYAEFAASKAGSTPKP